MRGGAACGGDGDDDAAVGGAGLVGGVVDGGLGLALAGDGIRPRSQIGEFGQPVAHGLGPVLRQLLVVGVVGDVVGVPHDVEAAAVGILSQLLGHNLQLAVGLVGQCRGVGVEGDVTGQGDRDVLVAGARAGRVVRGLGVALQGRDGRVLTGAAVLDDLVGLVQRLRTDPGSRRLVAADDAHRGEAGLGHEDDDLVDIDRSEHDRGRDRLAALELQGPSGCRPRGPHPSRAGGVDQTHAIGTTASSGRAQTGSGIGGVRISARVSARVVGAVRTALTVLRVVGGGGFLGVVCRQAAGVLDVGRRSVVSRAGDLQDQGRGGVTRAHQGRDPDRGVMPQQVAVEILPSGRAVVRRPGRGGGGGGGAIGRCSVLARIG